jgi:CBS domain-containing protein
MQQRIEEVRTMLIREVMTTPAVTVTTQSSTGTALCLMHEEQISSIPVVDYRGALIGVVSETDLVQNKSLVDDRVPAFAGRVSSTTPARRVSEVMTHRVVTARPDDEIEVAIDLMRSTMTDHLPVVENDRVVGTVCPSDMFDLLAERSHLNAEVSAGTAREADAVPSNRCCDH